ncbi:hypothetical protein SAMN05421747_10924 [Parapedobacter composti]|uniref:Uncharacterized protein n=1 Tax=Parapedobacter composti TaxID=623281 RepID=A0A1I1IE71_9SPHI|nr:hypothetical protein SAMN05421747_10924 [Parapedobacter composti]
MSSNVRVLEELSKTGLLNHYIITSHLEVCMFYTNRAIDEFGVFFINRWFIDCCDISDGWIEQVFFARCSNV